MADFEPTKYYISLIWALDDPADPMTKKIDESVRSAFMQREYVEPLARVVIVQVRDQFDRQRLLGALRYIAEEQWDGALSYVISPLLQKPAAWTGWATTDWEKLNRLTRERPTE